MKIYLSTSEIDDRPVYITGNFNKWNPKNPNFQLEKLKEGNYQIELDDDEVPEIVEFKFTKGGWENVELDQFGNITLNHKAKKSEKFIHAKVEKWRYNWGPFKKEFFPIVELIDEAFYIPQLDKTRKVWALLPHNYKETTDEYPVLYLQDAQNLFNESANFGNWEIDKKLAVLAEYGRGDLIVIAVEHGDDDRINEYVFENPRLTKNAEGKKYIRFITDTLKPYVDANFRTKKEREFTGIGGSSLGALISIYGGFLYPEVYSKLLLFSPSLWLEPENNFPMVHFQEAFATKVYIYGGKLEGSQMIKRIDQFEKSLKQWESQNLFEFEIRKSINQEGQHQEFYWSQEFPRAIEWLYFDSLKNPLENLKEKKEKTSCNNEK